MPSKKITLSSVKALGPGETVWDTETKGFGCRCQKASKVFIVKYRMGRGEVSRQRFYTIGSLGSPWTPETARNEAKRILGLISQAIDPAIDKGRENSLPCVSDAFTQYLAEFEGKRASSTQKEYRRVFNRILKVKLGNFRVSDVSRADIAKIHTKLSETPAQANRMREMLSGFFNWCEKQGFRPDGSNPCRHIKRYRDKKRERFLSEKELFLTSEALKQYEEEFHLLRGPFNDECQENVFTSYVIAALRLLIFTGARRGEILNLRWDQVDFTNRLLRLQESKTGQKTIYLSAPALEVLAGIPKMEGNPYVICGKGEKAPLVNIKDPWKRVCQLATLMVWQEIPELTEILSEHRQSAGRKNDRRLSEFEFLSQKAKQLKIQLPIGLLDVRIHDLRHNFASTGVTSGLHLKIVGSLLGHSNMRTTERYAHLANDPIQTANEAISAKILKLMSGPSLSSNVTRIR